MDPQDADERPDGLAPTRRVRCHGVCHTDRTIAALVTVTAMVLLSAFGVMRIVDAGVHASAALVSTGCQGLRATAGAIDRENGRSESEISPPESARRFGEGGVHRLAVPCEARPGLAGASPRRARLGVRSGPGSLGSLRAATRCVRAPGAVVTPRIEDPTSTAAFAPRVTSW